MKVFWKFSKVSVTSNKYTLGTLSPLLISSKHLVRLCNLLKDTARSEQTDNSVKFLLNPQGNNFFVKPKVLCNFWELICMAAKKSSSKMDGH